MGSFCGTPVESSGGGFRLRCLSRSHILLTVVLGEGLPSRRSFCGDGLNMEEVESSRQLSTVSYDPSRGVVGKQPGPSSAEHGASHREGRGVGEYSSCSPASVVVVCRTPRERVTGGLEGMTGSGLLRLSGSRQPSRGLGLPPVIKIDR